MPTRLQRSNYAVESGGIVRPVYSERSMKCYVVTDGELKSIALANGLAVFCFSVGSAFLTFGVDVAKDIALTPAIPPAGVVLDSVLKPASFVLAAAFFAGGIWALIWRRSMIALVKRESEKKLESQV